MNGKIIARYPYHNEAGQLAYECLRIEPGQDGRRKDFRYRRPARQGDVKGEWVWSLEGVEKVPYRLPEILDPGRRDHPVFVVEGEKDADTLRGLGFLATTNPCGAGKWLPEFGRYLKGRRCVILPDNDRPGRIHAMQVLGSLLYWQAASVRIVRLLGLPDGGDVSDWFDDSLKHYELPQCRRSFVEFVKKTPEYRLCAPPLQSA